jgi:branched-chain amino acid aminotransferase
MFATDEFVGIKPSDTYKFVIINSPVGAYYAEPVRVKIEEYYTRAAEGGVGRAKAAGNYGASLYPAKLAQQQGFHQLVWTDAKTHTFIEESGTMNILFVMDNKIITPTEDADTILRGTTKKTVLELARHWGIPVEERKVTVAEIIEAARSGKLQEAFGAGTAATIAPIAMIGYRDEKIMLPALETREMSLKIKAYLDGVKSGEIADTMHWIQKVC